MWQRIETPIDTILEDINSQLLDMAIRARIQFAEEHNYSVLDVGARLEQLQDGKFNIVPFYDPKGQVGI